MDHHRQQLQCLHDGGGPMETQDFDQSLQEPATQKMCVVVCGAKMQSEGECGKEDEKPG